MKILDIFKKKKEVETTFPENELERYLVEGASSIDARKNFYQKLMWNQLFVLTPDYLGKEEGVEKKEEGATVQLVSFDDGVIPVFTSLNRIFDQGVLKEKVSYVSLKGQDLFGITIGASFVLNPFSPYSKNLVTEEIEQLMNGTIYEQMDVDQQEEEKNTTFAKLYDLACEKQEGLIVLGDYRIQELKPKEKALLEESVSYFQQCLDIYEDHWPSMVLMAKSLQRLERHEEALALLEKAFIVEDENHSIPMEAALEAIHLQDLDKALFYSAESLKRKPNDFALMGNHAMNLVLAEKDEEALSLIEQALALEPRDKVNQNIKDLIVKVSNGSRNRPTMEESMRN